MSLRELLVGDPAPELRVSEFVKGPAVAAFEPGMVYVVECWATWCGPCRRSIPHLTRLQAAHPHVAVVAVAVSEPRPKAVRAFVAEQGDAMGYTVAIDLPPEEPGGRGWMRLNWCCAAYQVCIPTAFVVDRGGRIAWIGHPTEIDAPLASVTDGTWDLAARARAHREYIATHRVREAMAMNDAVRGLREAGDGRGALRAYDEAFVLHPELEATWGLHKLELFFSEDRAAASAYARHLVTHVAPLAPGLYHAVGLTALKVSLSAAERGGAPPERSLVMLALDTLLQAEARLDPAANPYAVASLNEDLARAQFALGRVQEATARAVSARDQALKAAATNAIRRIDDLLDRCRGAAGPAPLDAQPHVVCDGEACTIVLAPS